MKLYGHFCFIIYNIFVFFCLYKFVYAAIAMSSSTKVFQLLPLWVQNKQIQDETAVPCKPGLRSKHFSCAGEQGHAVLESPLGSTLKHCVDFRAKERGLIHVNGLKPGSLFTLELTNTRFGNFYVASNAWIVKLIIKYNVMRV